MNSLIDSKHRLPSLDGLRAVSIFMVVIGHASATVRVLSPNTSTVLGILGAGRLGVSVFFVISGFLITTLLSDEQRGTDNINLKNFYIRRAFRIFPAFYSYWLVAFTLSLLGYVYLTRIELVSSAVYIWNCVPRKVDHWFLGHTWSLSVEEQFYLLWPLVLKCSGPRRGKWVAFSIVALAPFLRVAAYVSFPSVRPLIGMMLATRADTLMTGALLALLAQSDSSFDKVKQVVKSGVIPGVALGFVALDTVLSLRFRGAYLLPVGYTVQNLVIALFLAHVVFHERTPLGHFLNHRVLVHVGTISYSLYLWQQLFLTPKNTTFTGWFPINIVCAFLAAELSYNFIERPFLGWRKRFSSSRDRALASIDRMSYITPPKQLAASASL
jgi:peptidoglycan/LPS O-acetylase OafA/YrhL